MNMVKVYNAKGEHVDSFRKMQSKEVHYRSGINWTAMIAKLNRNGFYIRSQFSHSGKTLVHSYVSH